MTHDDRLPSLDKLQAKIDEIKKPESNGSANSSYTDMSEAVRLVVDLVAGVLVGLGFGYLVDYWLNSTPWGVIIGLFIGVAAGTKNMLRSAELIDKKLNKQQKDDKNI